MLMMLIPIVRILVGIIIDFNPVWKKAYWPDDNDDDNDNGDDNDDNNDNNDGDDDDDDDGATDNVDTSRNSNGCQCSTSIKGVLS